MWELDHKESWALKNWCFWTVVLEKILESPLDYKKTQPVHPKGDQSWVFIGKIDADAETPILWPPHAKSWLIGKDPDAGRDWGRTRRGRQRMRWLELIERGKLKSFKRFILRLLQVWPPFSMLPASALFVADTRFSLLTKFLFHHQISVSPFS